jgi:hypothetical protein
MDKIGEKMKKQYVKEYMTLGKMKVFLVDGMFIRNNIDDDFTLAGHGLVFDYIPKNEIWLEHTIDKEELSIVLAHEMSERMIMKGGLEYDQAHELANIVEKACRKDPERTDSILEFLGGQNT